MDSTTIAVDIAKSVFEIAVSERPGSVARRERVSRSGFERFLAQAPPSTVLFEGCGMAHLSRGSTPAVLQPRRPTRLGTRSAIPTLPRGRRLPLPSPPGTTDVLRHERSAIDGGVQMRLVRRPQALCVLVGSNELVSVYSREGDGSSEGRAFDSAVVRYRHRDATAVLVQSFERNVFSLADDAKAELEKSAEYPRDWSVNGELRH